VWEDVSGGLDIINVGKFQMASRAYCGRFNFNGGDQQKRVGTLSGGERGRLHRAWAQHEYELGAAQGRRGQRGERRIKALQAAQAERDRAEALAQARAQAEAQNHSVKFMTYEELLKLQLGEDALAPIVGENEFDAWYKEYVAAEEKSARAKKVAFEKMPPAQQAYQELRICGAYSQEQY
jgi:hypothetical protein